MRKLLTLNSQEDYNLGVGYKALLTLISVIDLAATTYQKVALAMALGFGF